LLFVLFQRFSAQSVKGVLAAYVSWAAKQVENLGVDISMNTEYTAELFDKEKPDKVIIATGATHSRPSIWGLTDRRW